MFYLTIARPDRHITINFVLHWHFTDNTDFIIRMLYKNSY